MRILSAAVLFLLRAYQALLSPVSGGACRYVPSCSAYAVEAVRRHGPFRGGWLVVRRLGRCHPLGGYGFDPVPGAEPAVNRRK
ncbi:MAG: membrane protein insertion efficiency factor YidD [Acidobacteria bacterium]|nr:membrane protein insertion efficiency factor YidD [Acidobacteriota bacterium]